MLSLELHFVTSGLLPMNCHSVMGYFVAGTIGMGTET